VVWWSEGERRAGARATGALALLACLLPTGAARAYSAFPDYVMPIEEGGGGARFFTGTPADGYGCDSCHRGAVGSELTIQGLPADGYEPGASYEVTLSWGSAPHVALIAEASTEAGRPAGEVSLPPYATWTPEQLCESGDFPAADVCLLEPGSEGCCRELDPMRDACGFSGQRSALWVPDCGSRLARMVWTAPAGGDVWFGVSMVTSDLQNDAEGDGVTAWRRLMRPRGSSTELDAVTGDCSVRPAARGDGAGLLGVVCAGMVFVGALRRRARRRRG
jgi:hypothetical protein